MIDYLCLVLVVCRTGMATTLDEAQLLSGQFGVSEKRAADVMDVLRVCGTRRLNEFKNLGVTTYAFNPLQVCDATSRNF